MKKVNIKFVFVFAFVFVLVVDGMGGRVERGAAGVWARGHYRGIASLVAWAQRSYSSTITCIIITIIITILITIITITIIINITIALA